MLFHHRILYQSMDVPHQFKFEGSEAIVMKSLSICVCICISHKQKIIKNFFEFFKANDCSHSLNLTIGIY